jgi:hypothetical protein
LRKGEICRWIVNKCIGETQVVSINLISILRVYIISYISTKIHCDEICEITRVTQLSSNNKLIVTNTTINLSWFECENSWFQIDFLILSLQSVRLEYTLIIKQGQVKVLNSTWKYC